MSEEKNVPSFFEDIKVKYIGEKVSLILRLQPETWRNNIEKEELQTVLKNFFEKQYVLFLSVSSQGSVIASTEGPAASQSRQLILKKKAVTLNSDNYRDLLFGLLSASPLSQITDTVEQICVPILSNKNNHLMWPQVITEDIIRHAENLRSKMEIFRGQMLGKTVLPIPATATQIGHAYNAIQLYSCYNSAVVYKIESLVISWTNLVHKVLKEDSAELIMNDPNIVLNFWASRKSNVANIYKQLQSPIIQKMVKILETAESSYYPTINTVIGNVFNALQEAKDIDLHLTPLRAQLSHLEKEEFPKMEPLLPVLIHTVSLIWTHCPLYRKPDRAVMLLQALCSLLIQLASDYLSVQQLLREDTEEGLQRVKKVVKVFRCFEKNYQNQKEKLSNHGTSALWHFQSTMVFTQTNQFLDHVLQIEDFFQTILDFQKLEMLQFGGLRGKIYSEQAAQMYREFKELCQVLRHNDSLLDYNSKDFQRDYKDFKAKISDIECRLATLFCLAFDECSGCESTIKLFALIGPFLVRGQIRKIFSPKLLVLKRNFFEELDRCKHLYNSHHNQLEKGVDNNMPPTSGVIKWAKNLREQIQMLWENFRLLFDMFSGGADMVQEYNFYTEVLNLLDHYEDYVYLAWCKGLDEVCQLNLNLPLTSRNSSSGLISVNFSPKLTEVLKDVKYIQTFSQVHIPAAAIALFQKGDMLTKYVNGLQALVELYNRLKQTVLEVELPLIRDALLDIDVQLARAEGDLTWQDRDCWSFISGTSDLVHRLACRVQRSKDNCEAVQLLVKGWRKHTMFRRKDNKKSTLILLEDRAERVHKKYSSLQHDGESIHKFLQENMELYGADPAGEAWQAYLEYVDEIVVEGFFNAISSSLEFFVENMEPGLCRDPLFEAHLVLSGSEISFVPSLERDSGDGLYELIEGLLGDIFKMSTKVRRVAAHLNTESYQDVMDHMLSLLDLRQDIGNRVQNVLSKALDYHRRFDSYKHLWLNDRTEHLAKFLLFGNVLTGAESEVCGEDTLPESPPTIDKFKEQIDYYEDLHNNITMLEDFRVFDGWFRVDMKSLKLSLLNIVKKWSWLFKEHLITYVTNSLDDLEEFVQAKVKGLGQPVSKGDHHGLVDVLSHLVAIRDRQTSTDNMFGPLKDTLVLLKRYGVTVPEQVYIQLEELPEKWSAVKKLALSVRNEVAPMQNAQVMVVRRQCMEFEVKQNQFREKFRTDAPFTYHAVHPYACLDKYEKLIRDLEKERTELQKSTKLFDVTIPDYRNIKHCHREIILLKELWDLIAYVQSSVMDWTKTKWRQINVDQMDAELRRFAKDIRTLYKEARAWDVYSGLDLYVWNLMTSLRAVGELQNPAVRDRHWVQLIRTTKINFTMNDSSTLEDLLHLQLHLFEEDVHNIVDKAVKEMAIEKVISEINQTWAAMEFSYEDYHASVPLLKCNQDLIETLEDHQVQLQAISQSKHADHFLSRVLQLQKQLTVCDGVLTAWMEVQRAWVHLESVFLGCDDIFHQLPADTSRFLAIDADFQELMMDSAKIKNVIEATNKPSLYEKLEDLQKRLALCEKALAEYLERKRFAFPRFYFVSSADLLDILSKGSRPREVTCHLSKLFDNMSDLQFFEDEQTAASKVAVGMYSKEREYVQFQKPCNCDGPVELWLARLEDTMRGCIRGHLAEAVSTYEEKPREQWALDVPAQVALTGSQVWWTNDMVLAFSRLEEGFESALRDYNKKQIAQLNSLTSMLLGELSSGDRQKIMTMCTIDVHARDVVAGLVTQKVNSSQSFQWLSQLRHRWDEQQSHCFVNICDAQFLYSYEYLGNTARLVITPLTDRCYITLTQSLHLTMSGAPAGPAGTGKTETVKDLGRALGIMVYVFNCSEQMDYKSIGNIYKGLAQTGAWGCFDEFNRIAVDVLSVVAVQVKTIQDAIRNKKKRFLFLDEDIALKPSVGIFITMNPGYAGRTELPENLKALFRPCAMVVPDTELICEIMLVAEGFLSAKHLARKFITLYNLCKELLSKQDHYDWGLRAVKSVLVVAGALRREDKTRSEDQVLMSTLRDFNVSKLVTEDVAVFSGLLGDLFPGVVVERKREPQLEQVVRHTTVELRLQPEEAFILKVLQLEELLAVRHSVFVIGNAGTGKSQILKVLNNTYANLNKRPVWNDLNPKAVDTDELYGFVHPATREWKDGLLSSLMREQSSISHQGPKWIVLDGDIDPMWIESLNTVMDDNKILTLASNERVPLSSSMRLVFEISHLREATPATVSRAGILFVNPQDLGWSPYVATWIDTRVHQTERAHLTILFDKYVPRCIEQMRNAFKTIIPIPENSMVQTLCALLDCLLTPQNVPSDSTRELYETYFTFACIWAFGGALRQDQLHDYQVEFSHWWTKEMKTVKFPAQGTVFDYYLDPLTKRFLPWSDTVPSFVMDPDMPLQAVLVHTPQTVRLRYVLDLLAEKGQPLMLAGNAGVGKTALVNNKLDSLPESYAAAKVPFNYYTTSLALQTELERPLEKRAGRSYSPAGNRRLIYFIDDFNMPAVDTYGTVQAHTLIRQHLDYKHWYDRQKLCLKEVHNTQLVACMNPTAGSFSINPRLQRHFSVLAVHFPSAEAQSSIYSRILNGHLNQHLFPPPVQRTVSAVVQAAVSLHRKMVNNFLPTALRFHYIFNLRDLSSVFQGLLLARPETVRESVDMALLWLHESCRVYGDRMVDARDMQLFHKLQGDTLHECFEGVEYKQVTQQPLLYFHFDQGGEEALYSPVKEWSVLRTVLNEALESYNELNAAMNLVLFEDAMQHVCRISRILQSPGSHGLLVGVGGSGKQSLSRLAAYISSVEVFQIGLTLGYSFQDLKADLAGLFLKAGLKNHRIVLLLSDAQIRDERILVIINDLLTSGEIPELFSEEEIERIVAGVRTDVRASGVLDTRETCWRFFMNRARLQLKVVLCLSPVGGDLRVRARRFPALVHHTTVDWFHEWSQEALRSVSYRFIQEMDGIEPVAHESISLFMAYAHTSVNQASEKYQRNEKRYNYTTPKSFLQQIMLYRNLLAKSQNQLQDKMNRLDSGLQKLQTTATQVEDLKAKLASQEAELTAKNHNIEALIAKIGQQTEKIRLKKEAADAEVKKVAEIQTEVSVKQKDCESDLVKAEPALAAATAALNTLNKVNLTELKTFPNPPPAVINVAAAVMVLLAPRGRLPKDRSWKAARAFMGKVDDFLQALGSYDKEHIPEACLSVVKQQYLRSPGFQPDLVRTKSTAAAGLCAWTINIVKYYEVYCEVTPKRQALLQANVELETATAKMLAVQKRLADLDAHLRSLTMRFEKATAEKVSCQEEVAHTNQTIELANRLVTGLESEEERWSKAVAQYEEQQRRLCGDVLITAAFVCYLGYFTSRYRRDLLYNSWIPFLKSQKVSIPLTDGLDPVLMLADEATLAAWHTRGLPNDRMSTENAAILATSERWPLIVDPQQQGIAWVRHQYGSELRVLQLGQSGHQGVIEQALARGETVLIENVTETVDPVLEPLLARNTLKRGRYIRFGGKDCEYNSNFKLILHTKAANPHFPPELQAQTTLINFTVTPAGLEEQLLGQVVTWERPDLEALKLELTTQQNHFKIELKGLEDELLSRLSAAKGHFLGDISLVEQLESTKTTAAHVHCKVVEARENETKINEARELYRPAAERVSLLYFVINDLSRINPMYQFSLKSFIGVFQKAMAQAVWDDDVRSRVRNLTEAVTYSVFLHASQGLFERDKLTFLSHITFQVLGKRGLIDAQELDLLLRLPVDPSRVSPLPFLSSQAWGAIKTISTLEAFIGLDRDMESAPKRWRKIIESSFPERERLPHDWKNKSSLQKLIILRALRPDRMTYAIRNFVEENMGSRYVDAGRREFEKSFEDSGPSTPIFFILSPGVDPLKDVEKLGSKLGFSIEQGTLHNVSLGQGQEDVAERALQSARQLGHWVILQNVHLVAGWLPSLQSLLESTGEDSHRDYRVFISGEPAASPEQHAIPRGLLENAVKITSEPPTGMNASLHAALHSFSQDTLEMCSKEQEFNGLFFCLCYFHACVTERRKFGPQGWSCRYPFNTGDLTISVNVLCNYLEANSKVPWEDLCYLFGEILYGGHITDDWDRRLCQTYLKQYLNPKTLEGEHFLCPGFLVPPFMDYNGYHSYVDEHLPAESPSLYGLHPNAELDFLSAASKRLLRALVDIQPLDSCSVQDESHLEEKVKCVLYDLLDRLPEDYNMAEVMAKTAERGPYVLVCFQECERMNVLLAEIRRSLTELDLALKGESTMSSQTESLYSALFSDTVPASWARLAYPSTKTLAQWFTDLMCSCRELDTWTQDLVLPAVVWIPGLFQPQSFLMAVMQSIARKNQWPLDKMALTVDVTKMTKEDYGHPPREGAYIHGLFIEGARWDPHSGALAEAILRDLTPAMPVVYIRAAQEQDLAGTYPCPVYRTKLRGLTYVCTFHLRTKQPPPKWVLAGVALLLSA